MSRPPWIGIVTVRPSEWIHRSWLPVWRRLTKPGKRATRRKSRAVALGIHDFGRVLRQRGAASPILLRNHVEDARQLRHGLFSRGHQGVTPGDGGDLGDPRAIFLAIEHDLVGAEAGVGHV